MRLLLLAPGIEFLLTLGLSESVRTDTNRHWLMGVKPIFEIETLCNPMLRLSAGRLQ